MVTTDLACTAALPTIGMGMLSRPTQALVHCVDNARNKTALQFGQAALAVLAARDLSAKYRLYDRLTPTDK